MVRKILYLLIFSILVPFLTSCSSEEPKLSIITDIKTYMLELSSVQGITMTPQLEAKEQTKDIEYTWSTTEGGFINTIKNESKKEVNNTGEPVLWSPTLDTKKEKSSLIEVTLKAKKNDKVIAESKITIEETNGVYKVVE
jgi:CRISPR/Cas system endoribonuclease Cas6 (RAMP superfamily)